MFGSLLVWLFGPISLEEKVRREVARECGVDENQLPKIEYRPLPFIARMTKYGKTIIGKIAGAYDTLRHKIYIDPLDYLFSNLYEKVKLLAEEFYHAADNLKGKLKNKYNSFRDYIKNYHRDEDEIRAKEGAERIARRILDNYGSFSLYI
ncbi:MAG: hypothetical protein QXU74_03360 [Candidatus Aenigmatarchaeota archaeon]